MRKKVLVGISNIPLGAQTRGSENIERLLTDCADKMKEYSLRVLELPFNESYTDIGLLSKRIKVSPEDLSSEEEYLQKVGEYFKTISRNTIKKKKIHLWIYGSKYVDFVSSKEAEEFTIEALEKAATFARMIEARGLITLLGYAGKNREEALDKSITRLREIRDLLDDSQYLGIEIPGKRDVLGISAELRKALERIENSFPVINLAHYYALVGGQLRTEKEFFEPIKYFYERSNVKDFVYIKISGIEHENGNEKFHGALSINQPPVDVVARAIELFAKTYKNVEIYVLIDSPLLEHDAKYFIMRLREATNLAV